MVSYEKADIGVVSRLQDLVVDHHSGRLDGMKIGVLFRNGNPPKSAGVVVAAQTSLVGARWRPILSAPYHFVIAISKDWWKEADEAQRIACLDHELCHCGINENGEPRLIPHDLEEFGAVLGRHGFWRRDGGEYSVQSGLSQRGLFERGVEVEGAELTGETPCEEDAAALAVGE